jgi:hypothetical protein
LFLCDFLFQNNHMLFLKQSDRWTIREGKKDKRKWHPWVQERTFWGREYSVYLYFEQFRITFHVILRSYTFKVENFCLIYTFLWNKNFHLQFCGFPEQAISCHAMQNAHKWIILITMWNATKWFLYADFLRVLITIRFPFIHKSA